VDSKTQGADAPWVLLFTGGVFVTVP